MKKVKPIIATLISALNFNMVGCASPVTNFENYVKNNNAIEAAIDNENGENELRHEVYRPEVNDEENGQKNEVVNTITEDISDATIEVSEEIQEVDPLNALGLIEKSFVIANTDVNVRDEAGNIIGVLYEGRTMPFVTTTEDGRYVIDFYGNQGSVASEYASLTTKYDMSLPILKVGYAPNDTSIFIPQAFSVNGIDENVSIPSLECFEIYGEDDTTYFVRTNDYVGYIEKKAVTLLEDTFVVIDISDQELKLYKDNGIILTTPVVTGKPSTPTDEGLFKIYDISYSRYLVGPNYRSYVDIMMKYNGGEGLHDAEYHAHDNGFNHGWRAIGEFGGDTYLEDGSHGCVNMMHDEVMKVSEYVGLGTKVLVKK